MRTRRAITTAVAFALAGSLIEIVVVLFERRSHPMVKLSRDFLWMAPVALVAVTVATAILGLALTDIWKRRESPGVALFASAWVIFLHLLMLVPGLSHPAAAVLAAGLALQMTRIVVRRSSDTSRVTRIGASVAGGCLVLVAAGGWASWPTAVSHGPNRPTTLGSSRPPNVVLMTLDTVRAASLSLYGYPRATTPNIDQFAQRGVVFERAFATAPWTLPSHASLFTGRWPHELSAGYASPLDGTYPTLAEHFLARGYSTAGFVGNLGYCGFSTGLGRGFEHYEDYPRSLGQVASSSTLVRNVADNFRLRRLVQNDQHLNRVSAEDLNRRALAWLGDHGDAPFFVFMNYFDAHEPYLPPPPFDHAFPPGRARGRYSPLHHWLWDVSVAHRPMSADEVREERDAYDSSLAYLDDQVGRLLSEMDRRHLLEQTLVVITSDHGEELGEHALFDHGSSLYRPALQVPLVIVAPGLSGAHRVAEPVSVRDVAATIVGMTGVGANAPFPGESLAPSSDGTRGITARRDGLLSEVARASGQPDWFPTSKGDMQALVFRGMRYIRNGDGSEELYDLETDPWERRNVASQSEHASLLTAARLELEKLLGAEPRVSRLPVSR